jgi:Protein of unknown function (DUF3175)
LLPSSLSRSCGCRGYSLTVRGNVGTEAREFLVGVGQGAHDRHQFRAGDTVSGDALPVVDPRLETVEFYKISNLKVRVREAEEEPLAPPWFKPGCHSELAKDSEKIPDPGPIRCEQPNSLDPNFRTAQGDTVGWPPSSIANGPTPSHQDRCAPGDTTHLVERLPARVCSDASVARGLLADHALTPGPAKVLPMAATNKRKWSAKVKTVSTFPPQGTFTKPAEAVAKMMARKDVSPGGIGSAIRMVQMFINRAGKKLTAARKKELEKAKRILQRKQSTRPAPSVKRARKS